MEPDPTYSIVIPIHDEQESLQELHRRLVDVFPLLDGEVEVLLVDDGSTDLSYPVMLELHGRDPRFKVIQLARNFGHQLAITAGIELARGDAVAVMDGDLQHPPELLPALAERWREGYDVVYGVMTERPEGWLKRMTARTYYRVLRKLASVEIPAAAGDFRLADRRVDRGVSRDAGTESLRARHVRLARLPADRRAVRRPRAIRGQLEVHAAENDPARHRRPRQLLDRAACGLRSTSGSSSPGSRSSSASRRSSRSSRARSSCPGWLTIVLVTSFIGGIQLIVIGVVGEYVGRIYDEVKARPLYLVRELHGFEHEPIPRRALPPSELPRL